MIRIPTTLVLGAGASIPYGFPSGRALLMSICADIEQSDSHLVEHLVDLEHDISEIKAFGMALSRSMQPSVDAFLEHRSEFTEIGKAAIACRLIPCENVDKLGRTKEASWYEYLFAKLNARLEDFGSNRISVITFNYDRSLEVFLLSALQHSYGISEMDAGAILKQIPIIHVHGQLGALPCFDPGGRPYEPIVNAETLRKCVREIKIIHEAVDRDPEFIMARESIRTAERVCFLGFGYHPVNIERLGLQEIAGNHQLFGSAFGLDEAEQYDVSSMIGGKLHLGHRSLDSLLYLRRYFSFQ